MTQVASAPVAPTLENPTIFREVPQSIFQLSRPRVEVLNCKRNVQRWNSNSGPSYGNYTSPINGQKLVFSIRRQRNTPMFSLSKSYFLVGLNFSNAAGDGAAVRMAPDPFGMFSIFQEFRFSVNSSNQEIFKTMNGTELLPIAIEHCLMNYSRDQLREIHQGLFLPFDRVQDPLLSYKGAVDADSGVALRAANWVPTGADFAKIWYMPIYLQDICPRFADEYYNNIYELHFEIIIANNPPVLFGYNNGGAEDSDGRTRITSVEFMCQTMQPDEYAPDGPEIIPFAESRLYKRTTGSDNQEFVLTNIKSLQRFFMFRPTSLGAADAAKRIDLTLAGPIDTYCSSHSNFVLFDQGKTGADVTGPITSADDDINAITVANWHAPIVNIQARYGEHEMPILSQPTLIAQNATNCIPVFGNLFYHYLHARGILGTPIAPSLNLDEFARKMPFVCFAVNHGAEFPNRSAPADLSIKILPLSISSVRNIDVFIVTTSLCALAITTDGACAKYD